MERELLHRIIHQLAKDYALRRADHRLCNYNQVHTANRFGLTGNPPERSRFPSVDWRRTPEQCRTCTHTNQR